MTRDEITAVLTAHAAWARCDPNGTRAILRGADLSGADLSGADLSDADLSDAILSGANLSGADLSDADLRGAILRGAILSGADLRGAILRGADLSDAILSGADLSDADLSDAILSGATTMPDGIAWGEYLRDVVPALLTAGGRSLAEVATPEVWACHSWDNCPMAIAFCVRGANDVPALYRAQAEAFVQYFDARLIPLPSPSEGAA